MAIAIFLDRMCLALRASGLWLRYAVKFDPFLSLDCASVEGVGRNQILPSGNLVDNGNSEADLGGKGPDYDPQPLKKGERRKGHSTLLPSDCDCREGRFLLRRIDEMSRMPEPTKEDSSFKRKLSKREKKQLKKQGCYASQCVFTSA